MAHYMRAGGALAERWPTALYEDQKGALEDDLAHLLPSIDNPERAAQKEAHYRDAFDAGRLVFLDRLKFGNALVDAKGELNVKEIHDHEWVELDRQTHMVAIGKAKDGWFALQPAAADAVRLMMRTWDDD